MQKNNQTPPGPQGLEKDPGLRNILKLIFLAAVLVAAWFLLDRLIFGK